MEICRLRRLGIRKKSEDARVAKKRVKDANAKAELLKKKATRAELQQKQAELEQQEALKEKVTKTAAAALGILF
jgi:hypothetical protein